MNSFFVGVDAHQRKYAVCILDQNGKRVKELTPQGGLPLLLAELAKLPGRCAVCYEASCGYGHLYDQLSKLPNVQRITVAHPGQLRLIFRAKKKHDRVDARKLATLLFLDQVPAVYVPQVRVREWRRLIERRRKQVATATAIKNQLRAVLRTHGVQGPHRKALWTVKGLTWLQQLELPGELARDERDELLDTLAEARARLQRLTRRLDRLGAAHAGVQLLRTIPGVGPRTAEAVVAYIDNPARFARGKQVGSYFGLVPCQDQSAGTNRLGHITREGPATVRLLLSEAAWQGIRRSPEIRAFFERIQAGHPERRKIALVATAHWLARVMLAMLRSGEVSRFTKFPARGAPATNAVRQVA